MEKSLEPIQEKNVTKNELVNDGSGIYFNIEMFEHAWRLSNSFAASNMVPKAFIGKPENCMIAINMAARFELDPFFIMNNIYIIHGSTAMSTQFMISLLNKSGKFDPLQYKFVGEKGKLEYGCVAYAKHKESGIVLESTPVTWKVVENEGWSKKTGSKWKTMPDHMFRYRSAAFFCRIHAPEILMGMLTDHEANDIKKEQEYSYLDFDKSEDEIEDEIQEEEDDLLKLETIVGDDDE